MCMYVYSCMAVADGLLMYVCVCLREWSSQAEERVFGESGW